MVHVLLHEDVQFLQEAPGLGRHSGSNGGRIGAPKHTVEMNPSEGCPLSLVIQKCQTEFGGPEVEERNGILFVCNITQENHIQDLLLLTSLVLENRNEGVTSVTLKRQMASIIKDVLVFPSGT